MKSNLFYLAAGALALTACTSEDVVYDAVKTQNAISFENVVNKHSRSDDNDITKDNIGSFRVFGFYTTPDLDGDGNVYDETNPNPNPNPTQGQTAVELFHDVLVTSDSYGYWTYATGEVPMRYWVPGAHHYFYAYSCGRDVVQLDQANKKGTFGFDTDKPSEPKSRVLQIQDYVCDHTHQHDLIYASNVGLGPNSKDDDASLDNHFPGIVGSEKGNETVVFQFKHILSKVSASFTSNFPEGYIVDISNVQIYNIVNRADYTPISSQGMIDGTGQWLNTERTSEKNCYVDLMKSGDDNKILTAVTGASAPVGTGVGYVIPCDYNGFKEDGDKLVSLNFNIKVYNKGEVVFTKLMQGKFTPIWVPGYSYNYSITLDGGSAGLEAIAFTTVNDENGDKVAGWVSSGSASNPVFN